MIKKESRNEMRILRHERIRKQIIGTKDIPRLNVYRSNKNIYAQLIDDVNGVTLASASSLDMNGNNIEIATKVGEAIAEKYKDDITKIRNSTENDKKETIAYINSLNLSIPRASN